MPTYTGGGANPDHAASDAEAPAAETSQDGGADQTNETDPDNNA